MYLRGDFRYCHAEHKADDKIFPSGFYSKMPVELELVLVEKESVLRSLIGSKKVNFILNPLVFRQINSVYLYNP